MKLTTLINELQNLLGIHGDVNVLMYSDAEGNDVKELSAVCETNYSEVGWLGDLQTYHPDDLLEHTVLEIQELDIKTGVLLVPL